MEKFNLFGVFSHLLLIYDHLSRYSMVKSGYELVRKTLQEHNTAYNSEYWKRLIELRKGPTTIRIEKPINLPRAREVGYKAKEGYVVLITKVRRGTRAKKRINETRKNGNLGIRKITAKKSLQWISEERIAKKYPNLQVLNSYQIATDGLSHFFEIICVDPSHPAILADKNINWIANKSNKARVYRGLTSAGKKTRGLRSERYRSRKNPFFLTRQRELTVKIRTLFFIFQPFFTNFIIFYAYSLFWIVIYLVIMKVRPQYGTFTNGIPFVKFGVGGKTMLVFLGGPGNESPEGATFSTYSKGVQPFMQEYTIFLLTRKSGLSENYTTRDMAEDYAEMIQTEFNGKVNVIIGISYGSLIGQHLVADHPELFDHAILAMTGSENE